MMMDVPLAVFASVLGLPPFLLVAVCYCVAVHNPKKQEWKWHALHPGVPGHSRGETEGVRGLHPSLHPFRPAQPLK
ncbi:unnamed protein product [Pipistrellus nathusii]|uniref:Uncharacterized protein n=1 Tax=Pipistrellus nathusii TaxID=59473 RepID=A0ABP0AB27_PIPNA